MNVKAYALACSVPALILGLAAPRHASAQVAAPATPLPADPAPSQPASTSDAGPVGTPGVTPIKPPPAASDVASTKASPTGGIDDIVVTAQRRSESLQKVAVALSVISPEALSRAGVTQPQALATVLPGVQIANVGPLLQVYIRGVGDAGTGATSNPAIAFNIDGVYVSRTQSISTEFYDVDRVEVLKGPQGTLYGRNATGGAINLLTRKPVLNSYGLRFSAELGNYNSASIDGAVNVPIGTTAALRISGTYVNKGGYTSQGLLDDKHEAIRGKFLWEPNQGFSILLNGSAGHIGGIGGSQSVILNKVPGISHQSPWLDQTDPLVRSFLLSGVAPSLPKIPGVINPSNSSGLFENDNFYNFSAEISANLGFATLTVIPAYRHLSQSNSYVNFVRVSNGAGFGNVPPSPNLSRQTTLEVRLAKEVGGLKLVAGGYAYEEDQDAQYVNYSGLIQYLGAKYSLRSRSYAGFGQAIYSLTRHIRLIGGLRYTNDRPTIDGYSVTIAPSLRCTAVAGAVCPAESFNGTRTFNNVSWKGGAEADVLGDGLLYATASSGYKGGSFNAAISPNVASDSHVASSYEPEKLYAYEIGLKNRYFNRKLQLNLEGFYWDYRNLQQARIAVSGAGNSSYSFNNAGKARMFGASADIIAKPWIGGTFFGNVEYLNSKYLNFIVNQPARTYNAGSSGCLVTPSAITPGPSGPLVTINCAGFEVARSPKWSGSVGYTHHVSLPNGSAIEPEVDMRFASSRWLASDFIAAERAGSYQAVNATLTFISIGGRFTATAFVRNITNAAVYQGAFEAPFQPGLAVASIAPPRTYGARFSMNFR